LLTLIVNLIKDILVSHI